MENKKLWKTELYHIQLGAPKPKKIPCLKADVDRPAWFGDEFHGVLGHKEAATLLSTQGNGAYLVRKGNPGNDFCTLTWRFGNSTHHYKLYYDGAHYLRPSDKRYDSVAALVADGLIMTHMELHAKHILDFIQSQEGAAAYTNSPYVTLNRRKLKSLSRTQLNQNHEKILEKITISDSRDTDTMKSTDPLISSREEVNCGSEENVLAGYSKPHTFKLHTFKGLNWCEFCANFLWGFTAQGVKCEDCGFIAHSKCSERVPSHCVPDLKRLRGVFGIDLTTLLNAHASTLPFVVRKCATEIEERGMDSEGIYRVSGFADEIEALKMAFDRDGEAAQLCVFSNINVIAGALKLYLRLLPVPLITHQVHSHFLNTCRERDPEQQTQLLRECLSLLPPAHYNCLQYVIQHLHRVAQREEVNKMSAHNLSTVFAPTLVATPPAVTDLTFEIRALQTLIELAPQIYYGKA